ncbi:FecR family protein [Treponema pectinovorum]|uniref:FecR family protein n=1 Tax=Treponema pectinovorum TaxID=164 RepID=UPI0011F167A3|nr:FecR family protein [Treponema pectinovorum]
MKRAIKKLTAILFVTTIAIFTATSMEATVVSSKGKAEVQKGNSWAKLSVGNSLKKGDVIQTGFKSEVILKIKNSTVTVAPLSRVTIEQLAEKTDKDDTRLFLDTGSLKSDVKKTADRRVGFTVRSPVATASVRGTVMGVTNTFRSTEIVGYEGSVAAWKSSGNQTASVASDDESTHSTTEKENSASAVSDGQAAAGAILVKKNMTSSFTETAVVTPMENAAKEATDVGGTKTPTTQAGLASTEETKTAKKANVVISVSF